MMHMTLLESFDSPDNAMESAGPSPDWATGHLVGLAEGRALALSEQGRLSSDIVQSLADMSFGYAEARRHLLLSLRPLFMVLMDKFLPALVSDGLATQIVDLLQRTATEDLLTPIELHVHPDHVAGLQDLIRQAAMPITLRGDPRLGLGQAQMSSTDGETLLDLDELLGATRGALSAIFFTPEQRVHHG